MRFSLIFYEADVNWNIKHYLDKIITRMGLPEKNKVREREREESCVTTSERRA